jgi:hypothetical protein
VFHARQSFDCDQKDAQTLFVLEERVQLGLKVDTSPASTWAVIKSCGCLYDDLLVDAAEDGLRSMVNQLFGSVSLELTSGVGVLCFIKFKFVNRWAAAESESELSVVRTDGLPDLRKFVVVVAGWGGSG